MTADGRLETGDLIRIRRVLTMADWGARDEFCPAHVVFSRDTSVLLCPHGGFVRAGTGIMMGAFFLTVDYEAETVTGLLGDEYEIDVAGPPAEVAG